MKPDVTDWARVAETLGDLTAELKRLGERVAVLESAAALNASAGPPMMGRQQGPTADAAALGDGISEELVLVISAAIAAFLGKKPRIRQIHLLGHEAWAQQGRVMIQASHRLAVPITRSPQS